MKSAPDQTTIESARDKAHFITHSAVDVLLSRLDKVKRTGSGTWSARCSAHDDRGPSLTVRELDDGRILLHCFAGCDAYALTRDEYVEHAGKSYRMVYFLKFAESRTGKLVLIVSCHTSN